VSASPASRPAALYNAVVTHIRTEPIGNRFRYRTYIWYVDLDDLPRLARGLGWLARFESRDHIGNPGTSLRLNIDALLKEHGIELRDGTVRMLAHARTLGHVFNPISIFWCRHGDGELAAVVVEVHNTYGERHAYVLRPDETDRCEFDKELYVSPFYPAAGVYTMRLPEPDSKLAITATYKPPKGQPFRASLGGKRWPTSTRTVLWMSVRNPIVTMVVKARIHYQGILLWLRGLPVVPRAEGSNDRFAAS
jgi:DUF1365 family protein